MKIKVSFCVWGCRWSKRWIMRTWGLQQSGSSRMETFRWRAAELRIEDLSGRACHWTSSWWQRRKCGEIFKASIPGQVTLVGCGGGYLAQFLPIMAWDLHGPKKISRNYLPHLPRGMHPCLGLQCFGMSTRLPCRCFFFYLSRTIWHPLLPWQKLDFQVESLIQDEPSWAPRKNKHTRHI